MVDAARQPLIEVKAYTEVEKVEGFVGNFKVTLREKAKYVRADRCNGCAACAKACPVEVPNYFEMNLAPRKAGESIMVQRMPEAREIDEALLGRFELTKEVVTAVRNVRKQKNIPQKDPLTLRVIADENYPAEYAPVLQKMGNLSQIETTREKDPSAVGFLVKTTQYFVPMEGMIDIEAERKKLAGELEYLEGFLASVQKKLSNERFVSSAPEKVVANERTKQADAEAKIAALREQLAALK